MGDPTPIPLRVLVIDDEPNIRDTLALCIHSTGARADKVGTSAAALEALRLAPYDLAFCDLRLGPESGLDLLPRLLGRAPGPRRGRHHRLRHLRHRRGGHPARRARLPAQAVHAGADPPPASRPRAERRASRLAARRPGGPARRGRPRGPARHRPRPRMRAVLETLDAGRAATTWRCCCAARAAPARACWPAPSTPPARAGTAPSWSSTARPSPRSCWPASSSATPAAPSPARSATSPGASRRPRAAPSSSTRSARSRRPCRPSCCASSRRSASSGSARPGPAPPTCASWPPPTATWRPTVKAGRFREDLLYRLNVVEVTVPPLRERAEDILPLARRFLAFFARQAGAPPPELSPAAERALLAYPWPGNVRELRNAIERAVILSPGQVLEPESFPERMRGAAPATSRCWAATSPLEEIEREHIAARAGPHPHAGGGRAHPRASTPRRSGASARRRGAEPPHGRRSARPAGRDREREPEGAPLRRLALHADLARRGPAPSPGTM